MKRNKSLRTHAITLFFLTFGHDSVKTWCQALPWFSCKHRESHHWHIDKICRVWVLEDLTELWSQPKTNKSLLPKQSLIKYWLSYSVLIQLLVEIVGVLHGVFRTEGQCPWNWKQSMTFVLVFIYSLLWSRLCLPQLMHG